MKIKRLFSIVLSIALCLSLLPTAAMAEASTNGTELTADIGTLEDGNYYLSDDLQLTENLTIWGTVNLYLNGHMLKGTGEGSVITIGYKRTSNGSASMASTLNLYDDENSTETHTITAPTGEEVAVKGGVITGGVAEWGGGIYNKGSTLNVYGGTICGNKAETEANGKVAMGGGIFIEGNGSVNMFGGAISHNSAEDGGGLTFGRNESGKLKMEGGEISNNTASRDGGGVYINETGTTAILTDGWIRNNVAGNNGAGISLGGSYSFSGGTTSSLTLDGATIEENTIGIGGDYGGNGAGISAGAIFIMKSGAIRNNITDSSKNRLAANGGGVWAHGTMDFYGGEITGNRGRSAGIDVSGGTLNMYGGSITNNVGASSAKGAFLVGGVDVSNGSKFNLYGGAITGNTGNVGGVNVNRGEVLLSKTVTISNNFRTEPSPYIYVYQAANNVFMVDPSFLTISDDFDVSSPIGIVMQKPGTFTKAYPSGHNNIDPTAYFFSELEQYEVLLDSEKEAMLSPITYTISYNANGGTGAPDNQLKTHGEAITLTSAAPTYEGHLFLGWATTSDATSAEYEAGASYSQNEPLSLYAVWQIHEHTFSEETTSPTCTDRGYTTHTCTECGYSYQDSEVPALNHDYHKNVDKSVKATAAADGYDYYECSHDASHYYTVPTSVPTHDVYFVAGDTTVYTIQFKEGTESIDEPEVPAKNGYYGAWEPYDLITATSNITVRAIYTEIPTHTATFKIGDAVIAAVPFTEGDTALDEPRVPDKPNYVGAWDAYDLASAKSDITVEGHYTPVDPGAVSDLGGNAEASYSNGVVSITLRASAPSQTIKVTSEKTRPVDVVLVLDQSGSMKDTLGGRQSKRDALVSCANAFVQQLYQNAVATNAEHRIALVGFAYDAYSGGKYVNTGLLATASGTGKNYASLKASDYAAALLPIKNGGSINANVLSGINSIAAEGATAADLGLKMAKNIFAENPVNGERERIVIFITDGTPTCWGETPSLITQTAAEAITVANTIKNAQNAKIYSVGVEEKANPSAAFTSSTSGVTTNWVGNFVSYDFNRFLHAVSSNYPSAASMSNLRDGDKGAGYYMAVNNTASLSKIFDNILYNTVYELKTFDKATLSYTLTINFILTMEQELAMREALTASGLTDADILVVRNDNGTTALTFRNVPVKRGVVNGTAGYYATVSFDVSASQNASGTVTTGSASGVSYGSGDKAVSVGVADVTIPADRSVVVFKLNGKIYRMVDAAQGDTITVPESELATWTVPDGTTVNSTYAEFVATTNNTFSMKWVIDGAETVQSYHPGDAVTPPSAAKEGYIFTGWMPAAPSVMPAHDVICTATFTEHTHQWSETYKTGNCETGITTHYVCAACGETKSETTAAHAHSFTAVLSDNGSAGTTVEKLVCTDCGYSENQEVSFKVTQSITGKTKVLELNRFENDQLKPGATDKELEMRYYLGDDGGKIYRVTRIDADGTRTVYSARSEDGYLVFKLNHFSIYVIGELEGEAGQEQEVETLSYSESTQLLDSAQPTVDNTPLAENQSGSGNSKVDNSAGDSDTSGTSSRSGGSSGSRYSGGSSGSGSTSTSGVSPKPEDGKQTDGAWSNPFADVAEDAYYYKAVAWASQLGVTLGTSETAFSPSKTCSRGEIVTFLWRANGCPEPSLAKSPFNDLEENAYYYKAALWAYENGITNGASATSFAPGADCTRAQVVTFLWRAEGKPTASSTAAFADVSGSVYYTEAVAWATAREITNGTGNGNFSPTMTCTRAQIVTFLYRDLTEEAVA